CHHREYRENRTSAFPFFESTGPAVLEIGNPYKRGRGQSWPEGKRNLDSAVTLRPKQARREPGVAKAQKRNVSKSFLVFARPFQMIEDRLIAQLFATFLRGRGPLPLLRKACASPFPSPSTAESGLNNT